MTSNLSPPGVGFVPIDTGSFLVAGGAAGWVDTDVSATTGTDTNKVWVVGASGAGAQSAGARANGVTQAPTSWVSVTSLFVTKVSSTGHCDLYRGAADMTYLFLGYFL